MKKQRYGIFFFILLLIFLHGQENPPQTTQGSVGAVTIDGKLWNQIALRPVFPVGKFGICLDLILYIDASGNIHRDEWNFSSSSAIKNTLIDKIYYIRYGFPWDPFYFRVGALDFMTIGYGILVSGYSNVIQYPQVRKVGLDLRVKRKEISFQGFVSDFKENIGLFGIRVSRPLPGGFRGGISGVVDRNQYLGLKDSDGDDVPDLLDDFPHDRHLWADTDGDGIADGFDPDADGDNILDGGKDLNHDGIIDGTETVDLNGDGLPDGIPFDGDIVLKEEFRLNKGDPIWGIAMDMSYPFLEKKNVRIDVYAQVANLIGKTIDPRTGNQISTGMGLVPFGIASIFGPIRSNLEYRIIPKNGRFDFGYWDRSYDIERATFHAKEDGNVEVMTKESLLGRYGKQKGFFGKFAVDIGSLFIIGAEYQNLIGKIWDEKMNQFQQQQNQSFKVMASLRKKISRVRTVNFFYQQRNVPNPFKFEYSESTVMGYRIGINVSGGLTLNYIYRRTFRDLNGDRDVRDEGESINITTVETAFAI